MISALKNKKKSAEILLYYKNKIKLKLINYFWNWILNQWILNLIEIKFQNKIS